MVEGAYTSGEGLSSDICHGCSSNMANLLHRGSFHKKQVLIQSLATTVNNGAILFSLVEIRFHWSLSVVLSLRLSCFVLTRF